MKLFLILQILVVDDSKKIIFASIGSNVQLPGQIPPRTGQKQRLACNG